MNLTKINKWVRRTIFLIKKSIIKTNYNILTFFLFKKIFFFKVLLDLLNKDTSRRTNKDHEKIGALL